MPNRPYQTAALDAVRVASIQGCNRQLILYFLALTWYNHIMTSPVIWNIYCLRDPQSIQRLKDAHAEQAKRTTGVPRPEHIQKLLSDLRNGRQYSKESRAKMRESHLGGKHTVEQTEKIRKANTGKVKSEETKARLKQAWERRRLGLPPIWSTPRAKRGYASS